MSGVADWKSVDPAWEQVDALIEHALLKPDPVLDFALQNSAKSGLPDIAVSATQGKFLQMLVQISGAKRILEVGTLGGYSTIWLARGTSRDGTVLSIEAEHDYAAVAWQNIENANLDRKVEIRVGQALDVLDLLTGPFDFTFIDADKVNNINYVEAALRLSQPGAVIVVDNVVRQGDILDPQDESAIGTRELYEHLLNHPRLDATAVQTVGSKGWDGLLMARIT